MIKHVKKFGGYIDQNEPHKLILYKFTGVRGTYDNSDTLEKISRILFLRNKKMIENKFGNYEVHFAEDYTYEDFEKDMKGVQNEYK